MPIPPAAIVGANALGGLFSGLSSSSASKRATKEQAREFNVSKAADIRHHLEMVPLRDRLMYILAQRFGVNPTTFAASQRAYTPNAGGTDIEGAQGMYNQILGGMGYGGQKYAQQLLKQRFG